MIIGNMVGGIKGPKGDPGPQGIPGVNGQNGEKGESGKDGKSAYNYAVEGGYKGTEEEFSKRVAEDHSTDYIKDIINKSEEDTIIILNDSDKKPLKGLAILGKTQQANTIGAQLIPEIISEKKTINGITFEPISTNEIKIYGAATENASIPQRYFNMQQGTYTFSINRMVESSKMRVCLINKQGHPIIDIPSGQSTKTNNINETSELSVFLTIYKNTKINTSIQFMLNKGSDSLPYEVYSGGKPSPSPSYPQEIINAGKLNGETGKYEITVNLSSKNLFDREKAKKSIKLERIGCDAGIFRILSLHWC